MLVEAKESGTARAVEEIQAAKSLLGEVASQVLNLKKQATLEFAAGQFSQA